ncbi:acyl-CoA synthetase [Streptomyces sp. NPDC102340]|uniref:acyl-CoA synthetase n=1 Tax=unclassified Streptomyces TaxID=2593676 RepID=UPI00382189DB
MSAREGGLCPDAHASDRQAIVAGDSGEVVTYAELTDRSRRLARWLYEQGLRAGDHIAVVMANCPAYLEVCWAARRSGLYYTPVNRHLTASEIGYVLENSGARAVVAGSDLAGTVERAVRTDAEPLIRVAVGDLRPGWDNYAEVLCVTPPQPLAPEMEGEAMFYSSGTTGLPKGVLHPLSGRAFGDVGTTLTWRNRYGLDTSTVSLCPGPLYHAAPLVAAMSVHRHGGTVVVMDRFDAEQALALIERHRVSYAQFVPTMFIRMLKLDPEVRSSYDVSSLRTVAHAAAPCPVDVKRRMLEWWGPIIHEYYSGTEAPGRIGIGPEEWLAHPGSVGRPADGEIVILDRAGDPCAPGEDGTIWFTCPNGFAYHNEEHKTASAHNDRGWATLGDVGHLDDEGYLYLTGRLAHMIISGGVNIYPQEVENLLVLRDDVLDAAVIGVPDEEFGEQVKAVVETAAGVAASPALAAELIAWCRERLAHYKCPRSVDFVAELPRSPAGKLRKHVLEQRYR